jgi:hypothetical protein
MFRCSAQRSAQELEREQEEDTTSVTARRWESGRAEQSSAAGTAGRRVNRWLGGEAEGEGEERNGC